MIESFGASDPGCVRANNEDYFLILPSAGLYVVADGMGGAQAGEHASRLAVETVRDTIEAVAPPSSPDDLLDAFAKANQRVMREADADQAMEGMGTTLVAAVKAVPAGTSPQQTLEQVEPVLKSTKTQFQASYNGLACGSS